MTPTATKPPKSLHEKLADLVDTQEKAHQVVRDLKREASGWNAETEGMRAELSATFRTFPEQFDSAGQPREGTAAAELQRKVRERMATENPHEAKLPPAVGKFHEAEHETLRFRIEHSAQLLDPITEEGAEAIEKIRVALGDLVEATAAYGEAERKTLEFLETVPGLHGTDIAVTPEIHRLRDLAAAGLRHAEDFIPPCSRTLQPSVAGVQPAAYYVLNPDGTGYVRTTQASYNDHRRKEAAAA